MSVSDGDGGVGGGSPSVRFYTNQYTALLLLTTRPALPPSLSLSLSLSLCVCVCVCVCVQSPPLLPSSYFSSLFPRSYSVCFATAVCARAASRKSFHAVHVLGSMSDLVDGDLRWEEGGGGGRKWQSMTCNDPQSSDQHSSVTLAIHIW